MGTHISQEYDDSLEQIRTQVLAMAALAQKQFVGATEALLSNNIAKAKKIAKQDYKINEMEVSIDENCAQIIARRQPKAIDLRTVLMAIKLVTDLERIGDEAEKIAKFATELASDTDMTNFKFRKNLKYIIRVAQNMLKGAISSYKKLDSQKALAVSAMDLELDQEFENLNRLLITYMLDDSKNIENTLKVNYCARSIERAGDHAKNICEYVLYIVHGTDVRHTVE